MSRYIAEVFPCETQQPQLAAIEAFTKNRFTIGNQMRRNKSIHQVTCSELFGYFSDCFVCDNCGLNVSQLRRRARVCLTPSVGTCAQTKGIELRPLGSPLVCTK